MSFTLEKGLMTLYCKVLVIWEQVRNEPGTALQLMNH